MTSDYNDIVDVSLNSYGGSKTRSADMRYLRLDLISTAVDSINLAEPSATSHSQYPYNKVETSKSGHVREVDDTPGAERLFEMHAAGTYKEIQADGTQIIKIFGDDFHIALKDRTLFVGGNLTISCQGDASILVAGNSYTKVKGNVSNVVHGNVDWYVKGEWNVIAEKSIQLETLENLHIKARDSIKVWAKNTAWITASPVRINSSAFKIPKTKPLTAGLTIEESITTPAAKDLLLKKTNNTNLTSKITDSKSPKDRTKA